MSEENQDSSLERMRKRLYAPPSVDGVSPSSVSKAAPQKAESWQAEPLPPVPKKGLSGSAIFLIFSVGFFALAGIVAAVVLFLGGRSLSSDNLTISVEGPTTISGGESVPLLITIQNNNPTPAEGATLSLTFPEGTFAAENAGAPLSYVELPLGDIPAGGVVRETVRAAFFGEENTRIDIPMTVEYRTGQSNATFVSKRSYALVISTAPVTLSVTTLSEVQAGQPLTLVVKARSNVTAPIENVGVKAEYPFGFSLSSATPEPKGTMFSLGTLAAGEEKEVRITGTLSGTDGEERVFRFSSGSISGSDFGIAYSATEALLTLTKPFLAVSFLINREESDTAIITAGDTNSATLSWENTLSSDILDGTIEVKLSGEALDPASVKVANGFYSSATRTIRFDRDTDSGLAALAPGDRGNGSFTFSTKTGSALQSLRNPSISMAVSVSGRRVGEGSVPETVTSTISRTLKVATDLSLAARSVRTVGPYTNTGPWPPVADTETTYTILLSSLNSVNTVANASVKTTLPSYVRYTGEASSGVSYNESTREVTWAIGEMSAGSSKEASFKVALLPSISQKGTSPTLTGALTLSGYDRFSGKEVGGSMTALTIRTETDPSYQSSYGIVK